MAEFNDVSPEGTAGGAGFRDGDRVLTKDGEELIEVEVDDDEEPNDDSSTIWGTEIDNNEEMTMGEEEGFHSRSAEDVSISVFKGHNDNVYCAAIHPTQAGVVMSGGGDDKGYIWKYESIHQVEGDKSSTITSTLELDGHKDSVSTVGFNFDGSLALTGSFDGSCQIWNVTSGEKTMSLEGPEDIEWAQWHPKGNAIVAGSSDGTIWMWLATGQCMQVFAGHDGKVSCGLFSKDGKHIISGGDDGTVRIWNPKTGACKHTFEGAHFAHEGPVTCIASSGDGDNILTGSVDGKVRLYQISGKKVLQTLLHSTEMSVEKRDGGIGDDDGIEEEGGVLAVECVGFSLAEEFKWVASGGMDKTVKIWDSVTGSCRCICEHGGGVVALRWHTTLPLFATASLDNVVRLWDARSATSILDFTGHQDLVTNIEMSPLITPSENYNEENYPTDCIVSVSDDGTARVFHYNAPILMS